MIKGHYAIRCSGTTMGSRVMWQSRWRINVARDIVNKLVLRFGCLHRIYGLRCVYAERTCDRRSDRLLGILFIYRLKDCLSPKVFKLEQKGIDNSWFETRTFHWKIYQTNFDSYYFNGFKRLPASQSSISFAAITRNPYKLSHKQTLNAEIVYWQNNMWISSVQIYSRKYSGL